ncbi:hypothetical protein [Oerskovia enterophila]|uniref:Uncharacterized protein n=1 Tax=Oerskovia enterophila TaxID=43678 RepID=A0ABX2YD56_9CELL|nr:hypothetical protein [Oerskovia enterophila]OCI32906.1 hypothetical protein OERS_04980 [Oerskovia enterophila]
MSTPPVSDELFEAVDAVRQTHGVRNHFDRQTQRTVYQCGCGESWASGEWDLPRVDNSAAIRRHFVQALADAGLLKDHPTDGARTPSR